MALYVGAACERNGGTENTAQQLPPLQPFQERGNLSASTSATLFPAGDCKAGGNKPTLLYLVGQVCIDLVLESLLHIGVGGQVVGYVAEGGAGGLITSKDKDKSLGQNLLIT